MSSRKDEKDKKILGRAHNEAKRAPVWIFARTNRKIRFSPKSGRDWRADSIF